MNVHKWRHLKSAILNIPPLSLPLSAIISQKFRSLEGSLLAHHISQTTIPPSPSLYLRETSTWYLNDPFSPSLILVYKIWFNKLFWKFRISISIKRVSWRLIHRIHNSNFHNYHTSIGLKIRFNCKRISPCS